MLDCAILLALFVVGFQRLVKIYGPEQDGAVVGVLWSPSSGPFST